MRKTFGGAFALIMVALFSVAPASPATAAGGIHLYMAGKVGQKAVGTTIIFGADRFPTHPPDQAGANDETPNGLLVLTTSSGEGEPRDSGVWPEPDGWRGSYGSSQTHNVPASGNLAGSVTLPALPAGEYMLDWTVFGPWRAPERGYEGPIQGNLTLGNNSISIGTSLVWNFTIGGDGTFTAIGAVPLCELQMPPMCLPQLSGAMGGPSADEGPKIE